MTVPVSVSDSIQTLQVWLKELRDKGELADEADVGGTDRWIATERHIPQYRLETAANARLAPQYPATASATTAGTPRPSRLCS